MWICILKYINTFLWMSIYVVFILCCLLFFELIIVQLKNATFQWTESSYEPVVWDSCLATKSNTIGVYYIGQWCSMKQTSFSPLHHWQPGFRELLARIECIVLLFVFKINQHFASPVTQVNPDPISNSPQ